MSRRQGGEEADHYELHLTEAIVETVKAGLGISTLARWAVAPHLRAGTLRAIPLGRHGLSRRWFACHPKRRSRNPGVVERVRLLRERGVDGLS